MLVILYFNRITKERHFFRIAVNRDFYEGRHFLKTACFGLVVGAAISLLCGMMQSLEALMLLEIAGVISLLFLPLVEVTFSMLWLVSLVIVGFNLLKNVWPVLTVLPVSFTGDKLPANILLLIAIFFVVRAFLLHYKKSIWFTPQVKSGKRGRRIAYYKWKEFSVIPLIILFPADTYMSHVPYWPLFSFNGRSFGILVFPLLVAGAIKVFKEEPQLILKRAYGESLVLAGISFIVAALALLASWISLVGLLLIGIVSVLFYWQRKHLDKAGKRWYVETNDGVRVISVIPGTPAAKMGLSNGDIILDCNDEPVKNEPELYAALQKSSAYCRLRVKTFSGELKITESAIYAGAPHEIGLVLFQ